MNDEKNTYRIDDNIIVECINGVTKLYAVPIPDGKGSENNPFDFFKINKTISEKDIDVKLTTASKNKIKNSSISIEGIGSIGLIESIFDNTMTIFFHSKYVGSKPTEINISIENNECVIWDNGRIWKYDESVHDWTLIGITTMEYMEYRNHKK